MTEAQSVLSWVLDHVAVLLIPLMVWMVKTLLKVSQTVYGENGDNGLKGDVLRLRTARHEHASVLQRHDYHLEEHGRRIEKLEAVTE